LFTLLAKAVALGNVVLEKCARYLAGRSLATHALQSPQYSDKTVVVSQNVFAVQWRPEVW